MEPKITSLHVTSVVMSRFSRVTIDSEMKNEHDKARELIFVVRLPESAFITKLVMVVGDVTVTGVVKEKKAATEQYNKAVARGHSAGLITADVRETQTFNVSANVPAHSSATFKLVYQELLTRKLGSYDHVILVNPGQVIEDYVVTITIMEQTGITSLVAVPPHKTNESTPGIYGSGTEIFIETDVKRSEYQAKIIFRPTAEQQKRLLAIPEKDRKLTVKYDVPREIPGGEIQSRKGYFIHFFAPENLPVFPKNVVFVIDRSGSMSGTKIRQTKAAFRSIIKELREVDTFNIVAFSSDVVTWKSSMMEVTKDVIKKAVSHVNDLEASGGTDLNAALLCGARLLSDVKMEDRKSSMIIVLTDGDPTSGVTNRSGIRENVKEAVGGRFSVFCLGFGRDLDHNFLNRLADENDGISRRIYEDSDAAVQLQGFFQEVATPLLLHVKMTYLGANVSEVSQTSFNKYFAGSEAVIVGVVEEPAEKLTARVESMSVEKDVVFEASSNKFDDTFEEWMKEAGDFDDFIERIWAYFSIKEILQKASVSDSKAEKDKLNEYASSLALKYSFVTPLTSMVVTMPSDEEVQGKLSSSHPMSDVYGTEENLWNLCDPTNSYAGAGDTYDDANLDNLDMCLSEGYNSYSVSSTCMISAGSKKRKGRASRLLASEKLSTTDPRDLQRRNPITDKTQGTSTSWFKSLFQISRKKGSVSSNSSGEVVDEKWYKDDSKKAIEIILTKYKKIGTFFVRPSHVSTNEPYELMVWANDKCYSFSIMKSVSGSQETYKLLNGKNENETFISLLKLIEYFMQHPIQLPEDNGEVQLVGAPK